MTVVTVVTAVAMNPFPTSCRDKLHKCIVSYELKMINAWLKWWFCLVDLGNFGKDQRYSWAMPGRGRGCEFEGIVNLNFPCQCQFWKTFEKKHQISNCFFFLKSPQTHLRSTKFWKFPRDLCSLTRFSFLQVHIQCSILLKKFLAPSMIYPDNSLLCHSFAKEWKKDFVIRVSCFREVYVGLK